jgi:galactonate dehydratase
MNFTRRSFLQAAMALPIGVSLAHFEALAAPARNQIKITAIKAMQTADTGTIIRIETDAGLVGYGPCHGSGPRAREVLKDVEGGRGSNVGLGLVGKDPLAIKVHHHNLFYAYAQRDRHVRILSGVDIALWDLAGKILNVPVCKLLGGNFREEISLYSHCGHEGNFWSKEEWRARAKELVDYPSGFKAFKVDLNDALGVTARQFVPSLGPLEVRKVQLCYDLARSSFGPDIDIIVHGHNELDLPSAIQVAAAVEPIKPLYFEDPLAPLYSDSWAMLRRTTRIPLLTGEDIELLEGALPFIRNQAVDCLQLDLIDSGGITAIKAIADTASAYRMPISLHNVSGLLLNMASQQVAAAVHNCPRMECSRGSDKPKAAASNAPVIVDGKMKVSSQPGLGLDLNLDYLKANLPPGEPWWG